MLITVIALATNGCADFERLALSLHTQEFEDWKGHVVDVNSEDRIDKLMWPLNKTRRCSLLRDRFRYDCLSGPEPQLQDAWRGIVDRIASSSPRPMLVAVVPINMRFDYRALRAIAQTFKAGVDNVQMPLACGDPWMKGNDYFEYANFVKTELLPGRSSLGFHNGLQHPRINLRLDGCHTDGSIRQALGDYFTTASETRKQK